MLKRTITYEDFNGDSVTETFYFNLSRAEIIEMEVSYEGGLEAALRKIINERDNKKLVQEFKKLLLASYGVRSEDGRRFIKNDELREEFAQTAAYDALFMELATSAEAAATFVNGIIPPDIRELAEKQTPQDKPIGPPPVPKR